MRTFGRADPRAIRLERKKKKKIKYERHKEFDTRKKKRIIINEIKKYTNVRRAHCTRTRDRFIIVDGGPYFETSIVLGDITDESKEGKCRIKAGKKSTKNIL